VEATSFIFLFHILIENSPLYEITNARQPTEANLHPYIRSKCPDHIKGTQYGYVHKNIESEEYKHLNVDS